MSGRRSSRNQKPRELRRKVIVPARLRHGATWSDTCILNVSSRGLLIHTGRPIRDGSEVELRRGDHLIVARVVWREGARAGLRTLERVPVEEIVLLGRAAPLQSSVSNIDRRRRPRPQQPSRRRGRAVEFAGVLGIVACLAAAGLTMVDAAFARPLTLVTSTLAG